MRAADADVLFAPVSASDVSSELEAMAEILRRAVMVLGFSPILCPQNPLRLKLCAGVPIAPRDVGASVVTLARRVGLSFGLVLLLFGLNLVVYFWTSREKAESLAALRSA